VQITHNGKVTGAMRPFAFVLSKFHLINCQS